MAGDLKCVRLLNWLSHIVSSVETCLLSEETCYLVSHTFARSITAFFSKEQSWASCLLLLSTPCTCRPLPLQDASCLAAIEFIRAAATAAAGSDEGSIASYDLQAHALLLENLACRGSSRDTAAAALEGLVELLGGTAEWVREKDNSQQQAHELQQRYDMINAAAMVFAMMQPRCSTSWGMSWWSKVADHSPGVKTLLFSPQILSAYVWG